MQYISFYKNDNYYDITKYSDENIYILGIFLLHDFRSGWVSFKNWIFEHYECTSSNASFLIKQGNNIRIEDLYDDRETDDKPAFIISKEEYIKLLDMWVEVYNQKPDEILVTYEEGKINVEAINKT